MEVGWQSLNIAYSNCTGICFKLLSANKIIVLKVPHTALSDDVQYVGTVLLKG
jgi:hypothetical protein